MRKLYLIIAILTGQLILSCSGKREVEVTEITIEETVYTPEPPPPSFSCSSAVTLHEWFFKSCDMEKPRKDTVTYEFGFFETDNCYAVYLIDSGGYKKRGSVSANQNDDEQSVKYYPLSKNEYRDLDWKQVMSKMKLQLEDFAKSKKFINSSLAKAKSITLFFDDGEKVRLK